MVEQAPASTATEIVQNSTFERFARTGYVVSGLLHLTIGYLAIRIALGSNVGDADQSGALSAMGQAATAGSTQLATSPSPSRTPSCDRP